MTKCYWSFAALTSSLLKVQLQCTDSVSKLVFLLPSFSRLLWWQMVCLLLTGRRKESWVFSSFLFRKVCYADTGSVLVHFPSHFEENFLKVGAQQNLLGPTKPNSLVNGTQSMLSALYVCYGILNKIYFVFIYPGEHSVFEMLCSA